jgi:multidrug efflux pump subunit AcrB
LRDFAEVIDGTEEQRVFAFLNKTPAVKLSVQKQPDANTIKVVDALKQRLEELRQSDLISADMVLTPTLDESIFIRNSLTDVTTSAVSGALLAAAAVLLFLGSVRQTLIITLAIPLCTLAAIIFMKLFGLTINVFSLAGLAVGIGQAIDTSVVVLENVSERTDMISGRNEQLGRLKQKSISQEPKFFIESTIASSQEVGISFGCCYWCQLSFCTAIPANWRLYLAAI